MTGMTLLVNTLLGVATLASQIALAVLVVSVLAPDASFARLVRKYVGEYALVIGWVLVLGGLAGSLYYSEVAGFEPCVLCWWQRIFLYPQVLILAVGILRRDRGALFYALPLTAAGSLVALYHTYIQYGGSPWAVCGAAGISCTQRFVFVFDYITIPLMALTSFLLLGLVSWVGIAGSRQERIRP